MLGVGLVVLLLIAGVMLARSVQPVEVFAVLLFIPVFLGLVFWGLPGGLVGAALASIVYTGLRWSDIQLVGWSSLSGLILTRTVSYFVFGALGGWANEQLEASLTKLELYDQIDDESGLYNARFFVQDTELEMSRSQRYQTLFSVASVAVPVAALEPLSRRQRSGLLKDLGRLLRDSVRAVDRPVHGRDSKHHRFAVVLPETGKEGAQIFGERLASSIVAYMGKRGIRVASSEVDWKAVSFPAEEKQLRDEITRFATIAKEDHPSGHVGG